MFGMFKYIAGIKSCLVSKDGIMKCDVARVNHLFKFIDPDDLNDWEEKFYWSVREEFERWETLTKKQVNVLERIYNKGG
ncbi:hypothetical protein ES703_66342 [subsurface metagenome]